jgi:hypothetical protein
MQYACIFAAYIAHSMLDCIIHYTLLYYFSAQLLLNSAQSALCAVVSFSVCGHFMIMRRLNKLSASYAVIKTDKKNRRAITKHVLLRNMVLQRCSFFVSFAEKIKINALHIIFYTIFELRPPPVNYYHLHLLWCKLL